MQILNQNGLKKQYLVRENKYQIKLILWLFLKNNLYLIEVPHTLLFSTTVDLIQADYKYIIGSVKTSSC